MFSEYELSFFAPPYFELIRAGHLTQRERPPRGVFVVWDLKHTTDFVVAAEQVTRRPHGMGLVIVLPPPHELYRIRDVFEGLVDFHPCAILPASLNSSDRLCQLLRNLPRRPHQEFVEYFKRRGLLCDERSRQEVNKLFAESRVVHSVASLARRMSSSRRTLGRHFSQAGLPAPSRWLQFARLLYVSLYLQRNRCSIGRAAAELGYPDPFTMSNQMKRLTGLRPSEVKARFGWSWIAESWVVEETRRGGFDRDRYRRALAPYLVETTQQTLRPLQAPPHWPQSRTRSLEM